MTLPSYFTEQRRPCSRMGFDWLLDPRQTIDHSLIEHSIWEPHATAIVHEYVKPDMLAVDVGANIGYFTLLMAQLVGPGGYILAIEPAPVHELLQTHVEMNQLDSRVQVLPYALGPTDVLEAAAFNYSWPPQLGPAVSQPTHFRSLTSVMDEHGNDWAVDFLKIDTDGYELQVLEGAKLILTIERPVILIEVCEYTLRNIHKRNNDPSYRPGDMVRQLFAVLDDHGYELLNEKDRRPLRTAEEVLAVTDLNSRSFNALCLPR